MATLRDRIHIPDDEVRAMIAAGRHLQVASIAPDGRPHLVAMWYVVDDDGLMVFTTYAKSQKAKNLQRDPRVTVLLEDGAAYNEVRGVMIEGQAEVITDDPAQVALTLAHVGHKYGGGPDPALRDSPPPVTDAARKRCLIRIHPQRVRTWDHGRLAGAG